MNSVVFIGNQLSQKEEFADNMLAIHRARYSRSPESGTALDDGVPYHHFWAAMTQMFIDHRLIAISDFATSTILATVSSLLAVAVMLAYGRIFAFVFYLFLVFFYLVLNVLFAKFLGVYIPCFSVLFWTLVTLISAGFLEMTRQVYVEEKNRQTERMIQDGLQLKSNFISLISHNLNTPIAKAKGLLDILNANPRDRDFRIRVSSLVRVYTLLQVYIKSALSLISLRENSEARKELSVIVNRREFWSRLSENLSSNCSDLGWSFSGVDPELDQLEDQADVSLPDEKILSYLVLLQGLLLTPKGVGLEVTTRVLWGAGESGLCLFNLVVQFSQITSIDHYIVDESSVVQMSEREWQDSFAKKLLDSLKLNFLSKFLNSTETLDQDKNTTEWRLSFYL